MAQVNSLEQLRAEGRMRWNSTEHAWTAEPDEVASAVWFTSPDEHTSKMFIEIDGEPVVA